MRCPRCGAENPDDAEQCAGCNVLFVRKSVRVAHKVLGAENGAVVRGRHRRTMQIVILALSLCLVASIALAVVLSPSISPLASARDSDGDGHPDAYDAAPKNPELWAYVSATIMVIVQSSHPHSNFTYDISIDGRSMASGAIAAGQVKVENITVHFLIGKANSATVEMVASATDGSVLRKDLVLETGGWYQEPFDIPL